MEDFQSDHTQQEDVTTPASSISGLGLLMKPKNNNRQDSGEVQVNFKDEGELHGAVTFDKDPSKIIDYVLYYDATRDNELKKSWRKDFQENMADYGITIEEELSAKDCFVKLRCSFEGLCKGAELLKLMKPCKKADIEVDEHRNCCQCLKRRKKLHVRPHLPFTVKDKDEFLNIEDEKSFFDSGERNYIVHSLLEKTVFRCNGSFCTGLENLLDKNVYLAAYPLHNPLPDESSAADESTSERTVLLEKWARFGNMFKEQPLDNIRKYFGEQFTFYFAWMGLYTTFLSFSSLAGLACFIYGLSAFANSDVPTSDVCDRTRSPGNFVICPKCDFNCNYTILSDGCNYARFTRIFDNEATVLVAIFTCVWAICFLEFWKRKQMYLQCHWNVRDFEAEENIRPQYFNQVGVRSRKISGTKQLEMSSLCKSIRLFTSLSLILFLLTIVVGTIFSVLVYRLAVVNSLYRSEDPFIQNNAKLITTITAAVLNVFCISILSYLYNFIAKALTNLEAHRTRTSYEDSFIFKMVVFQFINNYGSIVYIAFFKGSFVDSPGKDTLYMFNKYKQDECEESGCFSELTIQLIIIMIGKQILNAIMEMSIPLIMKCIRSRGIQNKGQSKPWEKDMLLEPHSSIFMFSEYLEMVIQYGFVVMFMAAFPLAPLFALINNLAEIRLDAYKMVKMFRRPPAMKAQDIGAWQFCLKALSYVAVVTNAFIIAWTSGFIPRQVYALNNFNLTGYVEWSLSVRNVSELGEDKRPDPKKFPWASNVTECRYRPYSTPPFQVAKEYLPFYWQILCARWAFVIVFEHICFLLMSMARLIPDESGDVKHRRQRERMYASNVNIAGLFNFENLHRKNANFISTQSVEENEDVSDDHHDYYSIPHIIMNRGGETVHPNVN